MTLLCAAIKPKNYTLFAAFMTDKKAFNCQ